MKIICFLFVLTFCVLGCKKDNITTDPSVKLNFSSDTIFFDTVFTSICSTTQRIKVFNRNKRAVKISEIKLAGGSSSNYQININGLAVNSLQNVELAGNDSLNIFVKVTIDPDANELPFAVKDVLEFLTNGNRQQVILTAYGQNAHILNNTTVSANTIWDDRLPYLVYNSVIVNSGSTLTINKGAKICFHKNAELIIAGTLKVAGELNDSVTFSSDRLEPIYKEEPGQWTGLRFLESSKDNQINYGVIKNGIIGVRLSSLSNNSNPKLLLTNTRIYNMEVAGIYGDNADLAAFNNVVANCGRHLLYAVNGGRYNLKQNTFANFNFRFSRTTPSLYFSDQTGTSSFAMNVTLTNNIVWGSLQDELLIDKKNPTTFTQVIRKNNIRSKDISLEAAENFLNADPLFKNARELDFRLMPGTPAANKGEDLSTDAYFSSWLERDFNKKARLFPSDLGSYEQL